MPIHGVTEVLYEVSGLGWYVNQISVDKWEVTVDECWPDMDNTDSGIIGFLLEDGRVVKRDDPETKDEFAALQTKLEETPSTCPSQVQYGGSVWDEWCDKATDANASEWPSDKTERENREVIDGLVRVILESNNPDGTKLTEMRCILARVRPQVGFA